MYYVTCNCVKLSWNLFPLCVCVCWLRPWDIVLASRALCAAGRCYSSAKSNPETKESLYAPPKLPGQLGTMTGTVMYPDSKSEVWDVNSEIHNIACIGAACTHIQANTHTHLSPLVMNENSLYTPLISSFLPSPPVHYTSPPLPSPSSCPR